MRDLHLVLRSNEGDVIGHLVRGIQMLGSYGKEWELHSIGDVRLCGESPPCVQVLLTGRTGTTPEGWSRVEREVLWSLHSEEGERAPLYVKVVPEGWAPAGEIVLPASEFRHMCDWGHPEGLTPPDAGGEASPSL